MSDIIIKNLPFLGNMGLMYGVGQLTSTLMALLIVASLNALIIGLVIQGDR